MWKAEAEERVNNSVKRTEREKNRERKKVEIEYGRTGGRRGSLVTKRSGRKDRDIKEHDGSTFVVK